MFWIFGLDSYDREIVHMLRARISRGVSRNEVNA
jgi:hypothetical protein